MWCQEFALRLVICKASASLLPALFLRSSSMIDFGGGGGRKGEKSQIRINSQISSETKHKYFLFMDYQFTTISLKTKTSLLYSS